MPQPTTPSPDASGATDALLARLSDTRSPADIQRDHILAVADDAFHRVERALAEVSKWKGPLDLTALERAVARLASAADALEAV